VTILSVRPRRIGSVAAVSLSAPVWKVELGLAFNSALPPGAYDLVVRLTALNGSTIDLQIAVFDQIFRRLAEADSVGNCVGGSCNCRSELTRD